MIETTDERVKAVLREVISERPETVYASPEHMKQWPEDDSCFYVHTTEDDEDSEPGCVVGAVLARLGVPLHELREQEGMVATYVVPKVLTGITEDSTYLLRVVQAEQDRGTSWGMAYALATGEKA